MNTICISLAVVCSPVGRIDVNLTSVDRWCRNARAEGADLVCFPELNITGYSTRDSLKRLAQPIPGPVTDTLQATAERYDMAVIAGLAERGEAGAIYAAQVVVRPNVEPGVYRKVHVSPPEMGRIAPGSAAPLFDFRGVRFGVQLCYDAHFPELATRMAVDGIDLLLIPHASPRGTPQDKLASWERHLTARAFDNGIFVAACNAVGENGEGLSFPGVAVVFGPDGRRLDSGCFADEGLLTTRIDGSELTRVRSHRMRYFLPNRRPDVYGPPAEDSPETEG